MNTGENNLQQSAVSTQLVQKTNYGNAFSPLILNVARRGNKVSPRRQESFFVRALGTKNNSEFPTSLPQAEPQSAGQSDCYPIFKEHYGLQKLVAVPGTRSPRGDIETFSLRYQHGAGVTGSQEFAVTMLSLFAKHHEFD